MNYSVVLGCYYFPCCAVANLQLIKRHNGENTPILLAGDSGPRKAKKHQYNQINNVEKRFNRNRLGHRSGDLSVFYNGLLWAKENGFKTVAKISQRYWINKPNWLQEQSEKLLESDYPISGTYNRTEAVILAVDRLDFNFFKPVGRMKEWTEVYFWRKFRDNYLKWDIVTENREEPHPDVICKMSNSIEDYKRVADELGVELDRDFRTDQFFKFEKGYKVT